MTVHHRTGSGKRDFTDSDDDLWFADRGNFWGTINQMCLCAKCGKAEIKRHDEPTHYSGIFTPHVHFLCDDCYDSLPDPTPEQPA